MGKNNINQIKYISYFESLDALRFLSFIFVFGWHCTGYIDVGKSYFLKDYLSYTLGLGYLGVNFFFVLSGFLITYLLLIEKIKTGTINVSFFYFRRILRIFPLYYLVVFFSFFIFPIITHKYDWIMIKEHLASFIFFYNNFDRISSGFCGIGNDFLGILWSLAIEEQFYFFWPIIFYFLPTRWTVPLCMLIITFVLAFRGLHLNQTSVLYLSTFSVISDMAIGGILAYYIIYSEKLKTWIRDMDNWKIVLGYIIGISLIYYLKKYNKFDFIVVMDRVVIALFFSFIILEQQFSNHSILKLSKIKPLGKMGKYTYSLYCIHLIVIAIFTKIYYLIFAEGIYEKLDFYFISIGSLTISFLSSYLLYRYYEYPILKLKDRFKLI